MNMFDPLILVCAVGCGLIAGVFFAFSTSVMTALGKLPAASGIGAMQTVNVVIINPLFLGVFLGTAVACAVAGAMSLSRLDLPAGRCVILGSACYLIGSFVVTMRFNVPRNNKLARVNPETLEAEAVWRDYLTTWTAWNHVRTAASLAAAILFSVALR